MGGYRSTGQLIITKACYSKRSDTDLEVNKMYKQMYDLA